MCPRCCCCPEEYSLGVIPRHDISSGGEEKRAKSPISEISPSAVRVGDSAEAPQHLHRLGPPALPRQALERCVQQRHLAVQPVEVNQCLLERRLGERIIEMLAIDPLAVPLGREALALPVDAAVAKQLLGHPVAGHHPRAAKILAAAQQVPQPLGLRRRGMNEAERARPVEAHQLLGITAVGLHRSPARTGISDGATTSHATPIELSSRYTSKPPGPAS